ncbi:hypothetical protein H6784_04080 [Candidatus Nomurabacteria bacterium]|nr:hypothetical protein [Candidatus Nomurabacteria bacterium]
MAHISLETLRHEMVSKKIIATPGLLSLIKQEDLKPVIGLEQHSFTKITVSDLGLPDGSTLKMIYTKALAVGLNLCPSWVSYDLWIQNPGLLALDEACLVAMTPLIEPAGSLKVHQLWNDFGIKKIGIYHANPDTKYGKNCAWIFVLPSTKKSLL